MLLDYVKALELDALELLKCVVLAGSFWNWARFCGI